MDNAGSGGECRYARKKRSVTTDGTTDKTGAIGIPGEGTPLSAPEQYAASKARVERFRKTILPRAEESYRLTLAVFKGGQFEYLRVLQAQRVINEANLTYIQAQLDLWRAGSEIAGLLGEENWPFQK